MRRDRVPSSTPERPHREGSVEHPPKLMIKNKLLGSAWRVSRPQPGRERVRAVGTTPALMHTRCELDGEYKNPPTAKCRGYQFSLLIRSVPSSDRRLQTSPITRRRTGRLRCRMRSPARSL